MWLCFCSRGQCVVEFSKLPFFFGFRPLALYTVTHTHTHTHTHRADNHRHHNSVQSNTIDWLTDWLSYGFRTTRYRTGHFADVQSLGLVVKKLITTQQKQASTKTSTSISGDGCISTHADPMSTNCTNLIGTQLGMSSHPELYLRMSGRFIPF